MKIRNAGDNNVVNETIIDNCIDLSNYSLMFAIECKEQDGTIKS